MLHVLQKHHRRLQCIIHYTSQPRGVTKETTFNARCCKWDAAEEEEEEKAQLRTSNLYDNNNAP